MASNRKASIRQRWKHRRWSFAAGLLGVLAAGLLSLTPLVVHWELHTQDLRFERRGPRKTRAKIVIATISDSTLDAWPEPTVFWARRYAAAINAARRLGARWIGLDFIPAVSGGPDLDQQFALALSGGEVVLANSRPAGRKPKNPIPVLLFAHPEQTENIGFIDVKPDEIDGVVRRADVYEEDWRRHEIVPSFPAVLALRLRGQSPADAAALRALAPRGGPDSGVIWINYVGPPSSFPMLPIERLATGRLTRAEQGWLRDAVVLIGLTYADSNDQQWGPRRVDYDGVEIHAHTLATLVDRRPLRVATAAQTVFTTMALGAIIAIACTFLSTAWGLVLAAVVSGAWWWGAVHAYAADAVWPAAGPMLAVGLGWTGNQVARSLEEVRRRRWIEGLFGRYVTSGIVEYLLANPAHLELGGEECEASVLFLDIRGFTAYSQGQPPAAVLGELNTLFGEIAPVIERHAGLLYKYTGDGLLAVFGAPYAVEEHAGAAVAAAVEIVRVSRRISAARIAAGGKAVRVGCGVNSGRVVCGNLGGAKRAEYTVIGDTVNLAARLEELNKAPELNAEFPSEIVISAATYARLSQPPPTRGPFPFAIRGRDGPVMVYQVEISDE